MKCEVWKAIALAVAIECGGACVIKSGLPSSVTASNVRAVKFGMSRKNVEALLGPPISTESGYVNACNSTDAQTLTYFRKPAFAAIVQYPQLWVSLCSGAVAVVYARVGDPIDDEGIYEMSKKGMWESPEFDKLFP